jgi:hypothetical protein
MNKAFLGLQASSKLAGKERFWWKSAQILSLILGLVLVLLLFIRPSLGLILLWDILIPVAPALFVFAAGIWRNICPLGIVSLSPHHLNISKKKRLSLQQQGKLQLLGVVLLFLFIPLRHICLNTDGCFTGFFLVGIGILAFIMGYRYEWKSSWCAGMCPVHPVEKFYGSNPSIITKNAHCGTCRNCVLPCPDSTQQMNQTIDPKIHQKWSSYLLFGGLPGFIWAWFHVKDFLPFEISSFQIALAYIIPLAGLVSSLALFFLLRKAAFWEEENLIRLFGAASIICYYWYRLPALMGFGIYPEDGRLFDLTTMMSPVIMLIIQLTVSGFFLYWMLIRPANQKQWMYRPPFRDGR